MGKKKIVVTGAAGFLGQNFVMAAKERYTVIAIDKHQENLALLKRLNPTVQCVCIDLATESGWEKVLKSVDALVILHAQIAATSVDPFVVNNVSAMQKLVDAAVLHKVPYTLYMSSAAVNSSRKDDYARTKEEGERILARSTLAHAVLRPSMMYGPFDNKNVGWLMQFMRRSPVFPIVGHGRYYRQPVYVDDMVGVLLAMLAKKPVGVTHNINGDKIYFVDMVRIIRKSMGIWRLLVFLPVPLFLFLMRLYNFVLRKTEFTPDQVRSLTNGEVFSDFTWWSEYNVSKTSFAQGMRAFLRSRYARVVLKR